jgi:hypothetical protein
VGLFDNFEQAQRAVPRIESLGIGRENISVITSNASGQYGQPSTTTTPEEDPGVVAAETAKGAVAGGWTGALIGMAPLAVPGLGAIAALGWLTMTLVGMTVGAAVGLVGALTGAGVPHEHAVYYEEGVRRGGTLLAVKAEDTLADRVAQILREEGAVNIEERAAAWKQEGFNPTATTATSQQSSQTGTTANTQENAFRNDWQNNYANQGGRYEDYAPAYQYGQALATQPTYQGRDWNAIERDVQNDWNTRYPNTWERFRGPIQYGWVYTVRVITRPSAEGNLPGIQTGGHAADGTPDTRGITEKSADAVTGDRIDDKASKPVR